MMNVNIKYKYKCNLPAESAESVRNTKVTMPKNKFFISMSNKFSKRKNRNTTNTNTIFLPETGCHSNNMH